MQCINAFELYIIFQCSSLCIEIYISWHKQACILHKGIICDQLYFVISSPCESCKTTVWVTPLSSSMHCLYFPCRMVSSFIKMGFLHWWTRCCSKYSDLRGNRASLFQFQWIKSQEFLSFHNYEKNVNIHGSREKNSVTPPNVPTILLQHGWFSFIYTHSLKLFWLFGFKFQISNHFIHKYLSMYT